MDIREMLEEAGYEVVGDAGDGASVVRMCQVLKPDVIILDIKMPVLDGISAAKAIVAEQGSEAPAVIMLTAYHQRDLVEDAASAVVDAYLLKPVAEEQLAAAVDVALSRRHEVRRMAERISELDHKLRSRKIIEKARGILMARRNMTEEEAYAILRSASMRLRQPLERVAEIVVSGEDVSRLIDHEVDKPSRRLRGTLRHGPK